MGHLGANTQTRVEGLSITDVTPNSPAQNAGLAVADRLVNLDGAPATAKSLSDLLSAKKPGDKIKAQFSRNGATREVEIVLGKNSKRTYKIAPMDAPNPLQTEILNDWLRSRQ